ncbi:MAG: hypothetical protein EBX41_00535 [Chitinophagia bacterium]|nr:hypothetical protein [Chitinophagia bacterium]
MDFLSRVSALTLFSMAVALLLIVYGYISRMADIFFFWDSRTIGWTFFIFAFISFLFDTVTIKKYIRKPIWGEIIGIVLLSLLLIGKLSLVYMVRTSDAYKAARIYLAHDKKTIEEIGNYSGFTRFPMGYVQRSISKDGVIGTANIMMTIKGEKRYKDVIIILNLYNDSPDWIVREVD